MRPWSLAIDNKVAVYILIVMIVIVGFIFFAATGRGGEMAPQVDDADRPGQRREQQRGVAEQDVAIRPIERQRVEQHAKAGELCERFDSLHLVREGRIIDTVATYRGEGMNFM